MNLTADFACWQSILKQQKGFQSAKTRELKSGQQKIHSIKWSRDGAHLASGSADFTLKIWSLQGDSEEFSATAELREHTDGISQLCWNPVDSSQLATASFDRTFALWDIRQHNAAHRVQTDGENINICWSPNGQFVAVGTKNDHIRIIDVRTLQPIFSSDFSVEVNEFGWNASMSYFVLTMGQGNLLVYDTSSGQQLQKLNAHASNCYCIQFDPSGRFFATGGADAVVLVWDCKSFLPVQSFTSLTSATRTLGFSHDGNCLAAGSEDKVMEIWRMETGDSLYQVPVSGPVNSLDWHPSRQLVAFAEDLPVEDARNAYPIKIFGFENSA